MARNEIQEQIKALLNGPADCVLSDLAPKLSGIRDADIARCLELNQAALDVAIQLLRPSGSLLIKSFISNDLHGFTAELKNPFPPCNAPNRTRHCQGSSEFYFYAQGFLPVVDRSR